MKKFIVLIMVIALTVCMFAGCGNKNSDADSSSSETRTITDCLGREVEIPANVERIVPLANTPRMITYLGLTDKVVGISGFDEETLSPLQAYAYANKDKWRDLPVVGTDAMGATDYYPEQIISVKPDVILCTYTKELADEIQSKTGIPVVAVPMGTLFGKDYEEALRMLGDVCGVEDRAEEVISYINDCLDDLKTRTADVPDTDKPTILGAAATFKGSHGIEGVYSNYSVFNAIAANDVAKGISDKEGGVIVDKEQVIGWNPEYIFFDYSGLKLVKKDFEKNPNFYEQLTAVKNGNLYQYPNSTSYYSNVEIPIINSYYVASVIYPEQFSDVDFEKKASEIFKFFLNDSDYLSKLKDAGITYSKVTLNGDK
ncbi:iron ABC transporter substrate-binding protein [Anaerovorax odorimutans]|uniref:iron ABC transporter substrate-binding protein n=1 Tax=Anaerovorax odorimutans TaxID=109327 RepID=UPI000408151F|nr:iron ABC transporter substrate-binding protein [Anaerovorax odorimutans]